MELDRITHNAGIIIDTPSSFATAVRVGSEMKYPLLQMCVDLFNVNVIIVIGHEKLNVEMQRLFAQSASSRRSIAVLKIPKSGGVVDLDDLYRSRVLSYQIRTYFYGPLVHLPPSVPLTELGGEASMDLNLSPCSTSVKFGDLKIFRVGPESMAPSSALPIGASRVITELQPDPVDPANGGLLNAVLALLPLPSSHVNKKKIDEEPTDEELISSDIAGFILVTAVDNAKQRMTILSPNPGSLVGRIAIIGSYEWQD